MKQDRKRSSKRKVQAVAARTVQLPLPVLGVLLDAKSAFFELCIETGRSVLMAMQEADREVLCGEKGRHDSQRRAVRGGSTPQAMFWAEVAAIHGYDGAFESIRRILVPPSELARYHHEWNAPLEAAYVAARGHGAAAV